jgi:hypothetical protein
MEHLRLQPTNQVHEVRRGQNAIEQSARASTVNVAQIGVHASLNVADT